MDHIVCDGCWRLTPKSQELRLMLAAMALIAVAACGESSEDAYERGYDEGYNDALYAVCKALPDRVEHPSECLGF